jgi:hypothetical protein
MTLKNITLTTILTALISLTSFSQTTEEEFNYLTKGYKIQLESGLDMKKGYTIKDYGTWGTKYTDFERNATFKGLFRDGEDKPCAVLMIFKKTNNDYAEYVCIPHMESDEIIWTSAFENWKKAADSWSAGAGYSWGMIKFMSYQFSN